MSRNFSSFHIHLFVRPTSFGGGCGANFFPRKRAAASSVLYTADLLDWHHYRQLCFMTIKC